MNHDEWLRSISPHLFDPCYHCGVIARDHPDEPTLECQGFYRLPGLHGSNEPLPIDRRLRVVT